MKRTEKSKTNKTIDKGDSFFGMYKERFKGKSSLEIQKLLRRKLYLGEEIDL